MRDTRRNAVTLHAHASAPQFLTRSGAPAENSARRAY
jgi:hypothetical protein